MRERMHVYLCRVGEPLVLHSIICGGSALPEVWLRRTVGGHYAVSGFATGSFAEALAKLSRSEVPEPSGARLFRASHQVAHWSRGS